MIDLTTDHQSLDWTNAPISELTAHIDATHHEYLRKLLPRLSFLVDKIRDVHGDGHPELVTLSETFGRFVQGVEAHLGKEEVMGDHSAEHTESLAAFQEMRRLTSDFALPEGACNTYRMTFEKLVELEADMKEHIRKEALLFDRAKA